MKKIIAIFCFTLVTVLTGKAQVKVLGKIIPNGVIDQYPTHIDSLGQGGLMTFKTWQERNSIPQPRRKAGMLVRVKSATVDSTYTLGVGLTNADWTPYKSASNIADITGLQAALDSKENKAEKGNANGYASLDNGGKIPTSQLPDAILGALQFQTQWDASTNTPTIPTASTGNKGWFYITQVGGVYNGVTYNTGDWILSNGSAWERIPNSDAVTSVYGRIGAVVANSGDYNSNQITNSSGVSGVSASDALNTLNSNKANKDGSNATGTWSINISGSSSKLDNLTASNLSNPVIGYVNTIIGTNEVGAIKTFTIDGVKARMGVNDGSTLINNISGNADNSIFWNQYQHDMNSVINSDAGLIDYMLTVKGDKVSKSNVTAVQNKLGLGSAAYQPEHNFIRNLYDHIGNDVIYSADDYWAKGGLMTFGYGLNSNLPVNGPLLSVGGEFQNGKYSMQFQGGYDFNNLWFRTRNGDRPTNQWNTWKRLLTQDDINPGGETLQSVTDRSNSTTKAIITSDKLSSFIGLNNSQLDFQAISNTYSEIQSSKSGVTYEHPLILQRQGGNVGIGTTNPAHKFVVSNNGKEGFEIAIGESPVRGTILQSFDRESSVYKPIVYHASLHEFGQGNLVVSKDNPNLDWSTSQLQIQGTTPSIAFHWPGADASNLYMNSSGNLIWGGQGLFISDSYPITLPHQVPTKKYVDDKIVSAGGVTLNTYQEITAQKQFTDTLNVRGHRGIAWTENIGETGKLKRQIVVGNGDPSIESEVINILPKTSGVLLNGRHSQGGSLSGPTYTWTDLTSVSMGNANYTKVGRVVTVNFKVFITSNSTSTTVRSFAVDPPIPDWSTSSMVDHVYGYTNSNTSPVYRGQAQFASGAVTISIYNFPASTSGTLNITYSYLVPE